MAEKYSNKIARAVHASPVSEEYDLTGYSQAQCEQLGEELFAHTFQVPEQFRISFIVGGGKEVRQKYDANLPKWLSEVLRKHGFEDDNGASVANDCQKKYKYQEDTGKNVKRLHVFPSSEIVPTDTGGAKRELGNEDKVVQATAEDFPELLNAHVPAWLQLRRVQHVLTEFGKRLEAIEAKMIKCEDLTEEEAELYHADYADKELIAQKIHIVSSKMKHKVAAGELTPAEKDHLIAHAQEKLEALEEKVGGDEGEAPKSIPEGVAKAITSLKERIAKLEDVAARDVPLRKSKEILAVCPCVPSPC